MSDRLEPGLGTPSDTGLLRQVIDSMSDAVAFKDLEGRFLGCNKAYERLTGRTEKEFLGLSARDMFSPERAASFEAADAEVARTCVPTSVEVPFRLPDGRTARIDCARHPLTDANGQLAGILIVLREVTAQRTSEESLRASEEKYRLLAEYSSDAIWVLDLESERFAYVSPSVEPLWGYTPEEALATPLTAMVTPESYRSIKALIADTLPDFLSGKDGERRIERVQHRHRNGSVFWVEYHARYRYNDRHRIEVVGSSRNIEERIRAEATLRESEDMYRMIAENTIDGIWVYNLDQDRFTYLNPALGRMLGMPVATLAQMQLMDGLVPDFRGRIAKRIEEAVQELRIRPEEPISEVFELRQPTGSGAEIWVEVSARIRRNVQGEIEILAVSRNIERRKKAEREVLSLSYQDALTGLRNRRSMEEEMQRQDEAQDLPVSVLVGDVDGLKHVNDSLGHEMGDEMLVLASQAIRSSCRPDDHVFRWGGDEFVIFLPHTARSSAEKVVERIRATCEGLRVGPVRLGISLGTATKERREERMADVLRTADEAMYRAKSNRVPS